MTMDTDPTFLTEEDWQHLLEWVDANVDSLDYALYDDYEDLYNDRMKDA